MDRGRFEAMWRATARAPKLLVAAFVAADPRGKAFLVLWAMLLGWFWFMGYGLVSIGEFVPGFLFVVIGAVIAAPVVWLVNAWDVARADPPATASGDAVEQVIGSMAMLRGGFVYGPMASGTLHVDGTGLRFVASTRTRAGALGGESMAQLGRRFGLVGALAAEALDVARGGGPPPEGGVYSFEIPRATIVSSTFSFFGGQLTMATTEGPAYWTVHFTSRLALCRALRSHGIPLAVS